MKSIIENGLIFIQVECYVDFHFKRHMLIFFFVSIHTSKIICGFIITAWNQNSEVNEK